MFIHLFLILHFFFNDTATTKIYTLSLHDALPIWATDVPDVPSSPGSEKERYTSWFCAKFGSMRSEEHTSELQSRLHLVCRLLLEKKKHHIAYLRCIFPCRFSYYSHVLDYHILPTH